MLHNGFRFPAVLLAAALLLPAFTAAGQEPQARSVELRLLSLSRGYSRPLGATAARIKELKGIEGVEALGFHGDAASFRVLTRLDNQALADALQLKLIGASGDRLALASEDSPRARRSEARSAVMQIALKIMAEPKPNWRVESEPVFKDADSTLEKLARLGLPTDLLDGITYKTRDYHIEEEWLGQEGNYKIWAGEKWEGVYVPSDEWREEEEGEETDSAPPDPNSRFVGIRVYRSSWSTSLSWADHEGLLLTGFPGQRSDTDSSGELCVKRGADWLTAVLSAAGAARVRAPATAIENLPSGRGWEAISNLRDNESEEGDKDISQWDIPNFELQCLRLDWRDDNGRWIARATAHHSYHPFYLEAELDSQAVLEAYKSLPGDARAKLRRVDTSAAIQWIVGAEKDAGVFHARRQEAAANAQLVCAALKDALREHPLDALCGRLDDAELCKRLGLKLVASAFKAGDYTIRRQMLGDVEFSVGDVRTGGRCWTLLNAAEGKVIRSNR